MQGCIYLIKNIVEIVLQFKITGFYFIMFEM